MSNQHTEVIVPSEVPRTAGSLNNGQDYERKLLLFIAASLSQNKEVKDFGIVSNPKGINKIDDVVVRVYFEDSKKDFALFVQSKLAKSESKELWLNSRQKKRQNRTNKIEIILPDFEIEFKKVLELMSSNKSEETKELCELLTGVPQERYYVCIFTNTNVDSDYILLTKKFDENDPIFCCLDTGVEIESGVRYYQFDITDNTNKLCKDFSNQLHIFSGQPNNNSMDESNEKLLGQDFRPVLPNLDKNLKDFMQKGDRCCVLKKAEFEEQCLKVMLIKWLRDDLKQVDRINPKFKQIWCKILSHQTVINLEDEGIWPLFANYYQGVIDKNDHHHNEAEKLFSLWRENKIPLAIKSEYTPNILNFLIRFKTLRRRFVIFSSKYSLELKEYRSQESVITYVREITDEATLEEIFNLEVQLQGRHPVTLREISAVPLETAVEGIFKDLAISQVLTWTEKKTNLHIIGPQLRPPDVNYVTRYFSLKDTKQIKLAEKTVLALVSPGLFIITGEPGMGKSTVLEALAYSYTPQNVVIYIKLRDCLHDIENPEILPSIKSDPLKYFFDKMLNNTDDKITKSIMEIHRTSKRLCLFLDAFDEILPSHGREISSFMTTILEKTDIPIVCTLRPHAEEKITSIAAAICFKLLPLDNKQQRKYFKKKNINSNIRWRLGSEFLSNPLHLHMISQIYEDQENRENITRGGMYKLFIRLKHKTYNNKMNLSENVANLKIVTSMKQHCDLAMVEIFGEECVTSKGLITETRLAEILKEICDQNIGIVDVRNSNRSFQFVHRTFAEYFVADWFLHNIVPSDSVPENFKQFYKAIWYENAYRDIKRMIEEGTRNYDLWFEARKYFLINYANKDKSSKCTCDGFLGWLECTISHPKVNGSTIVDSINMDYPSCTRLSEDDGDTCIKLLTALHIENKEDVEYILNRSQSLLDTGMGIATFNLAITTGNESIVKILLDMRPTLVDEQDVNGNTGLHISCAFGYSSIAGLLYERRDNFGVRNKKDKTPLGMATENKQLEVFSMGFIGEIGIRSREDENTSFSNDLSEALVAASRECKWDIIGKLLEYGVDPSISDVNGWTPMHFAARDGAGIKIMKMLLNKVFDIDARTNDSKTPLTIARDSRNWNIVKLLLEHGADPTISDENGWTLMHFAARGGHLEIAQILLERGLSVNAKANDDKTPLIIACDFWKSNIAKWLLQQDADVSLADRDGWTPMHVAAKKPKRYFINIDMLQIMKALLRKRPNIYVKTKNGETPLDIAARQGFPNMVELLREHAGEDFGYTE